jgi:hypothetical protein
MTKTTITPIKPSDLSSQKQKLIPEFVIESFNEIVAKCWNGHYSEFKQNEVIKIMILKSEGWEGRKEIDEMHASRQEAELRQLFFEQHFLDIEPIFESVGWNVEYDKPAWNETYEATFKFTKKRQQTNRRRSGWRR